MADKPIYRRILLKMSGEALMGQGPHPIEPSTLDRIAREIQGVVKLGVQVGVVVGGGNFFRGLALSKAGINRITGDNMGMLATIMNALALRDSLEKIGMPVRILSAISVAGVADQFHRRKALHHLESGRVVIFSGGTGNPLVTTVAAGSLRGIEIGADILLKATQVDGIYSADPRSNPDAKLYHQVSFQEALERELAVMDLAAFCQCRDHNLPIRVFNLHKPDSLLHVVCSTEEGTLVTE